MGATNAPQYTVTFTSVGRFFFQWVTASRSCHNNSVLRRAVGAKRNPRRNAHFLSETGSGTRATAARWFPFKTIKGEGDKHIQQHSGYRGKLLHRDLEKIFLNVMLSDSGQCSERARAALCYMLNVTGGRRMTGLKSACLHGQPHHLPTSLYS